MCDELTKQGCPNGQPCLNLIDNGLEAPAAAVGFKPWPLQAPKIIVGGDASYGLTSNKVRATIAVRYALDLF